MSSIIEFFREANLILSVPSTVIFLVAGIFLTFKTRFLQVRSIPRFFKILRRGVAEKKQQGVRTMSSTHALFTAMATTLGMGNVVAPSVAILAGGPGALFWLVVYAFFSSVTKFTEVTFAIRTREKKSDGRLVGGPAQYLRYISPVLGVWYGVLTLVLFPGWCAMQSNTLAEVLSFEGVAPWMTGVGLAVLLLAIIFGGVSRVGNVASKLVPIMFVLYIVFASTILFANSGLLVHALGLVFKHAFTPCAAAGGFLGSSVYAALSSGVYRGIYITEAGIGTSSIPHALADVKRATDQGVLAMFSVAADATLSIVSGLLVLVTGIWLKTDNFTTAMIYHVFKAHSPFWGKYILILSIALLVFSTILGNSFNGAQMFISFFKYRFIKIYYIILGIVVFFGAIANVRLVWDITEIILALVAIPNLIGLIVLSIKRGNVLKE